MSHLFRRIVASAIRIRGDSQSGLIIVGVRHFDTLMISQLHAIGFIPNNPPTCDQGFVDNDGKYVDRYEAWNIAKMANQIHLTSGSTEGKLHSEDLW